VGTYALAIRSAVTSSTEGDTLAGSSLNYAAGSTERQSNGVVVRGPVGAALSGTWRCMGRSSTYTLGDYTAVGSTVWLRIS
jgi:hypothetical protein